MVYFCVTTITRGDNCGIHRAMKYRSVALDGAVWKDVYTHARIHTVNSPLTDKQSVVIAGTWCGEKVCDIREGLPEVLLSVIIIIIPLIFHKIITSW